MHGAIPSHSIDMRVVVSIRVKQCHRQRVGALGRKMVFFYLFTRTRAASSRSRRPARAATTRLPIQTYTHSLRSHTRIDPHTCTWTPCSLSKRTHAHDALLARSGMAQKRVSFRAAQNDWRRERDPFYAFLRFLRTGRTVMCFVQCELKRKPVQRTGTDRHHGDFGLAICCVGSMASKT